MSVSLSMDPLTPGAPVQLQFLFSVFFCMICVFQPLSSQSCIGSNLSCTSCVQTFPIWLESTQDNILEKKLSGEKDKNPRSYLTPTLLWQLAHSLMREKGGWVGWGSCPLSDFSPLHVCGGRHIKSKGAISSLNNGMWADFSWPGVSCHHQYITMGFWVKAQWRWVSLSISEREAEGRERRESQLLL